MCLLFVALGQHAKWPLILASNRDEFFHRPSQPGHFWAGQCNLLGGRDQEQGGTWLGVNRQGKIAAVTNFRAPGEAKGKHSRGLLVRDYLTGEQAAGEYIRQLSATDYSGYNLLLGDARQLYYTSNRTPPPQTATPNPAPQPLAQGIYGLSNHLLDTPWPKVESGRAAFAQAIQPAQVQVEQLFELMSDSRQAAERDLPHTGIDLAAERWLSSRFIAPVEFAQRSYGTRTTTVILMRADGSGHWFERNHQPDGINRRETLAFSW